MLPTCCRSRKGFSHLQNGRGQCEDNEGESLVDYEPNLKFINLISCEHERYLKLPYHVSFVVPLHIIIVIVIIVITMIIAIYSNKAGIQSSHSSIVEYGYLKDCCVSVRLLLLLLVLYIVTEGTVLPFDTAT